MTVLVIATRQHFQAAGRFDRAEFLCASVPNAGLGHVGGQPFHAEFLQHHGIAGPRQREGCTRLAPLCGALQYQTNGSKVAASYEVLAAFLPMCRSPRGTKLRNTKPRFAASVVAANCRAWCISSRRSARLYLVVSATAPVNS